MFSDHHQGSGMHRDILVIIAIVKMVIDDYHRPVPVTQRTPGNDCRIPVPVNPGRAPVHGGDPVPAQAEPPVPAAVVIDRPAPGFSRNPGPADPRIPDPAPVKIGSPLNVSDHWNPDVTIGTFIDPAAVGSQLGFVFSYFFGEVGAAVITGPGQKLFPPVVPALKIIVGETVPTGVPEVTFFHHYRFATVKNKRILLPGNFQLPFHHRRFGPPLFVHLKAVKAFGQNIKGSIWSVQSEALFPGQGADPQVEPSPEQVN